MANGTILTVNNALVAAVTTLISAIVYGAVFMTTLDSRVNTNTVHIAEMRQMQGEQAKLINTIQQNCAKQTYILDTLFNQVQKEHP